MESFKIAATIEGTKWHTGEKSVENKYLDLENGTCDVNSDLVNLNGVVYDENLLDNSLNINELTDLYNTTTCP